MSNVLEHWQDEQCPIDCECCVCAVGGCDVCKSADWDTAEEVRRREQARMVVVALWDALA